MCKWRCKGNGLEWFGNWYKIPFEITNFCLNQRGKLMFLNYISEHGFWQWMLECVITVVFQSPSESFFQSVFDAKGNSLTIDYRNPWWVASVFIDYNRMRKIASDYNGRIEGMGTSKSAKNEPWIFHLDYSLIQKRFTFTDTVKITSTHPSIHHPREVWKASKLFFPRVKTFAEFNGNFKTIAHIIWHWMFDTRFEAIFLEFFF